MILYEPKELQLSDLHALDSRILHEVKEANSTVLNATVLINKHLSDLDVSAVSSVSQGSLKNFTRITMATNAIPTLVDPVDAADAPHHQVMLLILLGIFTTISLSISLAVIVFCRKKNTVFMLQKCEQESDVEMDDLPTEIENSDTDSEDVRAVLRVKRSESYPGLAKYTNGHKAESSNSYLTSENKQFQSPSLIPLLKKTYSSKGAMVSDKCIYHEEHQTSKSLHKSNTFSTQQECLNLLISPHKQLDSDFKFRNCSRLKNSSASKRNYITILTERELCLKENSTVIDCERLDNIRIDLQKISDRQDEKDNILTLDEKQLDFHGKLEIL